MGQDAKQDSGLSSVGEFGLIDLIDLPHPHPETVVVGIGDDCAVLPYSATRYQLVSCDLLVEDVHFVADKITSYQLGYKAVSVNLSDIAAMGGTPSHILVSAALPPDYTVAQWQELYRGIGDICNKYGVNVVGGDTTLSKDKLTLNVTVLGTVLHEQLHLRSDAEVGDAVFVTGALGGSRAGLELVLHPNLRVDDALRDAVLQCHYQPEPCCDEIAVLNQIAGVHLHALNDISDGLTSECHEIAHASDVAIVLDADKIPVNESAVQLAAQIGADGMQWALAGGEDYQLVGTMDGTQAEAICAAYKVQTGKAITIVGYVTEGTGVYWNTVAGVRPIEKKGYNHFSDTTKSDMGVQNDIAGEISQLLLEQISDLTQQAEAHSVYRHDLKNHLSCVLGLLECGDSKGAEGYLRQLLDTAPTAQTQVYHPRVVLNLLCNQKAKIAREKGIEFQFHDDTDDGQDLLAHIPDYDLCALVGNLLDNGLEHAGGTEPYVYMDLFCDDAGNIVLRMENSCQTPPILYHGMFTSCKADTASHGKGMKQIQRITEQYRGEFSWQYDQEHDRFLTQCMFVL